MSGADSPVLAAHAVLAFFGFEMLLVTVIDQRVEAGDAFGDDAAAAPAIAAVRPAVGNEFFTPETDAAVAAVAADIDFCFVEDAYL